MPPEDVKRLRESFWAMMRGEISPEELTRICKEFDKQKTLFKEEDNGTGKVAPADGE